MKLFILSFVVLFLSLSTVQAREEGISVREANSRISTPSTPAPSSVPVPTPAPRSDIPIPTPRPDNTDDEDILNSSGAGCSYSGNGDIGDALAGCLSGTNLVQSGDFRVEGDFKNKINSWTRAIAGILGLLAVGAIVYGALLMTISAGEDEKIKKGKDVVKWSIIGFIAVVTASALISVVVNFIFAVAS